MNSRDQSKALSLELIDENTWIISDTHFGHDNILKYEPTRQEQMAIEGIDCQNEWMIASWNSVVGKDDLVLHLGDFSFKGKATWFKHLNGRVVMV